MTRLLISPKYLRLLADAMEKCGMKKMSIEDIDNFINGIKFGLANRAENTILGDLIIEEFEIMKTIGPRSPNVRGDGSLKS